MRKTSTAELGYFTLRSGRVLRFEHEQDLESETHAFDAVSEANGRRYVVRIPLSAVGVLRLALEEFDRRVRGD